MKFAGIFALCTLADFCGAAEPLRLHPQNPHYFLFREKPTVLVTSTEHYGAVLNRDFDFVPYLDELKSHGLNLTRTFSGVYCEVPGNFKIKDNTLAPAEGRFLCPWARSDQPAYAGGGNKFDLTRWDGVYFQRLKQFISEASKRGIVVELVLFCPFYEDSMWSRSPLNATNNINGIGKLRRTDVFALKDEALTGAQDAVVRKLAAELKEFDNLYYEICNEPYFGGVTLDWQAHIAAALTAAEKGPAAPHLIAQNIANGSQKIAKPNEHVSIFNFHYATPPDAVGMNFALNKPLGDDETGFRGSDDVVYRSEGWEFLLAGGAVYDNLDYSFTTDYEAGTATPNAPGGGGRQLRQQLGFLKRFVESFNFVDMQPDKTVITGTLPSNTSVQVLANAGREYAIYLRGGELTELSLRLPEGKYRAEWFHPESGQSVSVHELAVETGPAHIAAPSYQHDLALAIRRVNR